MSSPPPSPQILSQGERDRTQALADDDPIPPPPFTPNPDVETPMPLSPAPSPPPRPPQRTLVPESNSDNDAATATPEIPLLAETPISSNPVSPFPALKLQPSSQPPKEKDLDIVPESQPISQELPEENVPQINQTSPSSKKVDLPDAQDKSAEKPTDSQIQTQPKPSVSPVSKPISPNVIPTQPETAPEPTSEETRNGADTYVASQPPQQQPRVTFESENPQNTDTIEKTDDTPSKDKMIIDERSKPSSQVEEHNSPVPTSRPRRRNGPARRVSAPILPEGNTEKDATSDDDSPLIIPSPNEDEDDDDEPFTRGRTTRRSSAKQRRSSPVRKPRRYSEPVLPLLSQRPRRKKKQIKKPAKGDRLTILWPIDLIYYEGEVESVLAYRGKKFYDINYDSGEKEYYVDLDTRKWRFLDSPEDDISMDLETDEDEEEEIDYTGFPKIDDRVMIMWHVDGKYYPGEVKDILTARNKIYYDVDYDGGDKEYFLDLHLRKWRFPSQENVSGKKPKKKKQSKKSTTPRRPPVPLPPQQVSPLRRMPTEPPDSPPFEPLHIPESPSPPRSQSKHSRVSSLDKPFRSNQSQALSRNPVSTTQASRRTSFTPRHDYGVVNSTAKYPSTSLLSSPESVDNHDLQEQDQDDIMPLIENPNLLRPSSLSKRPRVPEATSYQERFHSKRKRVGIESMSHPRPPPDGNRRPRTTISAIVNVAGLVAKKWALQETKEIESSLTKLDRQIRDLRHFTEQQKEEDRRMKELQEKEKREAEKSRPPELPRDEADVFMASFRNNVVSLVKKYRTTVETRETMLKKRFTELRDQLSAQNVNLLESGRMLSRLDVKGIDSLKELEPTMRKRLEHPPAVKPLIPQQGQLNEENIGLQTLTQDGLKTLDNGVSLGEPASAVTRNLRRRLADLVTRSDWLSDEVKRLRDREKELMKGNKAALQELQAAKSAREEAESAVYEVAAEAANIKKKVTFKKPPSVSVPGRKVTQAKPVGITKSRVARKVKSTTPSGGRSSGRANRKSLPRGPTKYKPPPPTQEPTLVDTLPKEAAPVSVVLTAPLKKILPVPQPPKLDSPMEAVIPSVRDHEKYVKNFPAQLGKQMDRQASDLLALIATVWLLQDTKRSEPPKEYNAQLEEWALSCVHKCLRHAQVFLESSSGIMSARKSLRDEVDGEHIYTEWIQSDDNEVIEAARQNYLLWEPTLKDIEWRAEKGVIKGLNVVIRKAMQLTSAGRYSATIMYAKAIVARALADFKQLLSGPIVEKNVKPMTADFRAKYEEAMKPGWKGLKTGRNDISNTEPTATEADKTMEIKIPRVPMAPKLLAPRPVGLVIPPAPPIPARLVRRQPLSDGKTTESEIAPGLTIKSTGLISKPPPVEPAATHNASLQQLEAAQASKVLTKPKDPSTSGENETGEVRDQIQDSEQNPQSTTQEESNVTGKANISGTLVAPVEHNETLPVNAKSRDPPTTGSGDTVNQETTTQPSTDQGADPPRLEIDHDVEMTDAVGPSNEKNQEAAGANQGATVTSQTPQTGPLQASVTNNAISTEQNETDLQDNKTRPVNPSSKLASQGKQTNLSTGAEHLTTTDNDTNQDAQMTQAHVAAKRVVKSDAPTKRRVGRPSKAKSNEKGVSGATRRVGRPSGRKSGSQPTKSRSRSQKANASANAGTVTTTGKQQQTSAEQVEDPVPATALDITAATPGVAPGANDTTEAGTTLVNQPEANAGTEETTLPATEPTASRRPPPRKSSERASQGKGQNIAQEPPQTQSRTGKGSRTQARGNKVIATETSRPKPKVGYEVIRRQVGAKHPISRSTPGTEQTLRNNTEDEAMATTRIPRSVHQEPLATQRPWETSTPTSIPVTQISTQATMRPFTPVQSQLPSSTLQPSSVHTSGHDEMEQVLASSSGAMDTNFPLNRDSPIRGQHPQQAQEGYGIGSGRMYDTAGKSLAQKSVPNYSYASKSIPVSQVAGKSLPHHQVMAGKALLSYDQRLMDNNTNVGMKGLPNKSGTSPTSARPRRVGQTSMFQATAKKNQIGFKRVPYPPIRRSARQAAAKGHEGGYVGEMRLPSTNIPFEGGIGHKSVPREGEGIFSTENQHQQGYGQDREMTHMDPLNPPTPSSFPPLDGYPLSLEPPTPDMGGERFVGVSSPINYSNDMFLQPNAQPSPPQTTGSGHQNLQGIGHLVNPSRDESLPGMAYGQGSRGQQQRYSGHERR